MASSAGNNLKHFEKASKLGHLEVINNEFVKEILSELVSDDVNDESLYNNSIWNKYKLNKVDPLKHIWVVDGSYSNVIENKKEVCYVKVALMTIQQEKIAAIDKYNPHPLQIKEIKKGSAEFHCTVFPLKNIRGKDNNLYDTVRQLIYKSMQQDDDGEAKFYATIKWLVYKKWDKDHNCNSPSFYCPHCNRNVEGGFEFDSDEMNCPYCGEKILLTDMLGFQQDMEEEQANLKVATSYMMIMEHLMLFTIIRLQWENKDSKIMSDTLFIKDGPLILGSQFAKLVPYVRDFIKFAYESGRPIHIIGCEKSGTFFDYLDTVSKFIRSENDVIKYAIPTHEYIRKEIQRVPDREESYGYRTNWGEKVFVMKDRISRYVLNIPPIEYKKDKNSPIESDIIGLDRILETIPSIIGRQYEGALYPITLANSIASLSNYPSSHILAKFTEEKTKKI